MLSFLFVSLPYTLKTKGVKHVSFCDLSFYSLQLLLINTFCIVMQLGLSGFSFIVSAFLKICLIQEIVTPAVTE